MSQFVAKKLQEAMNSTPQGASELKAMLSTTHSCCGYVNGFAGETKDWDEDYVLVVIKVKKDDAMAIKNLALVKLQW